MNPATVALVALLVFAWASTSRFLARHLISGPMLFATAGLVLANPQWGHVQANIETASMHVLVEITLALVLFADAARVNIRELRHDLGLPIRLLGIGLPLSILVGSLLAGALIPGIPWALAGLLGAALAPTDAALSAAVIGDERLPIRLRRTLNVESGLNDGIATPIVTFMLVAATSQLIDVNQSVPTEIWHALRDLGIGIGCGCVAGIGGAVLLDLATRRKAVDSDSRRLATLAIAVLAYALAVAIEGNGFIAAFAAGAAFGAAGRGGDATVQRDVELPELGGDLLAMVVWFLFGATLLPIAFGHVQASTLVYAVLSLTVVRMIPVALCMVRSGLDRQSMLFVSWFGPRGLASIVFAVLAIEELGEHNPGADRVVSTMALTILMSVILHGISAAPGIRSYLRSEAGSTVPGPRARRAGRTGMGPPIAGRP